MVGVFIALAQVLRYLTLGQPWRMNATAIVSLSTKRPADEIAVADSGNSSSARVAESMGKVRVYRVRLNRSLLIAN
jgi:hypothetical protein